MSDAYEEREQREIDERKQAKARAAQFRKDVQAMFSVEGNRKVLMGFLSAANVDGSAYREEPVSMAHAVGWLDAANWWMTAIRQHCPEREAQMRAEARRADKLDEADND